MTRRFADFSRPTPRPLTWLDLLWAIPALMFGAIVAFVIALTAAPYVRAHEAVSGFQYPLDCCSGFDCQEISEQRVRSEPGGYVVDGTFHIPQSEVRFSPDGRYHGCFPKPDRVTGLFVPPMGS